MTVEPTVYSELVNSLREQLKLQQAISCQYSVDLEARDEFVTVLQTRLNYYEEALARQCSELEQRRMSMKSMGHTVSRLEILCRQLEEELERSREKSRVSGASSLENANNQPNSDGLRAILEQQIEDLTRRQKNMEAEIHLLNQERQYASENTSRLEGLLRNGDTELREARTRDVEIEQEAGELRSQVSSAAREQACAIDEQRRLYNELEQREAMTKSQLELAIREKADKDVTIRTLHDQTTHLTKEVEQLRRQVHGLKQENADKEVKIVQLNKLHHQHQEDKAGLNMALDAKQQELSLIKRKLYVKGTSGLTPAQSSTSESSRRRGSLAFTTPVTRLRPSSSLGMSHSHSHNSQSHSTPLTKAASTEDTTGLTTVKPNKIGLPVGSPPLNPSINLKHQATLTERSPKRQHFKNVNGTPAASRHAHHRRSSSVTSISSNVTSGSEKENTRTKSRVSVPA